jgi:hypothetical protein
MEYMYTKWKMTAKARNLNLGKCAMARSIVCSTATPVVSAEDGIEDASQACGLASLESWCKPAKGPERQVARGAVELWRV